MPLRKREMRSREIDEMHVEITTRTSRNYSCLVCMTPRLVLPTKGYSQAPTAAPRRRAGASCRGRGARRLASLFAHALAAMSVVVGRLLHLLLVGARGGRLQFVVRGGRGLAGFGAHGASGVRGCFWGVGGDGEVEWVLGEVEAEAGRLLVLWARDQNLGERRKTRADADGASSLNGARGQGRGQESGAMATRLCALGRRWCRYL